MKLRLRSLQSKETLKVEVSNQCNLQQLKETLALAFSSSPAPDSLLLSLNRKDELFSSSLQDSLQSLGVTSGDLIYFSHNPDEFSPPPPQQTQQGSFQESDSFVNANHRVREPSSKEIEISQELDVIGLNSSNQEASIQDTQMGESLENHQELAAVNDMHVDTGSVDVGDRRMHESYFLRSVLREEEFGDDFSDSLLLFVGIHAVFLESGFVGLDSVSGLRVDLFHLLREQPLMTFTTSVSYTLPALLSNDNVTDSVVLKFQTLGQFVNVYGSISKSQSLVYKSCLDKCRFVPTIGSIWANWDNGDTMYNEDIVFELWKTVKDQLALPLLIDLCQKTGLDLPVCLMQMPADVKLKVLELLPGTDTARMACVCKEMKHLSSNSGLWKQKYEEEFGSLPEGHRVNNWKKRFVSSWENRKRRKRLSRPVPVAVPPSIRNDPYHRFIIPPPGIIGGDYDRFPGLNVPTPLGYPGLFPPHVYGRIPRPMFRRNRTLNCNLGGSNA